MSILRGAGLPASGVQFGPHLVNTNAISPKKSGRIFGSRPTHTAARSARGPRFRPNRWFGTGTIAWSVEAIRPSRELEGEAEADIVVAVVRLVVVAVRGAAVLRIVVPVAAAQHAVRTLWRLPKYQFSSKTISISMFYECYEWQDMPLVFCLTPFI